MSTKTPVHTSGWQLHGTGPGDGSSALEWSSDLELRQLETGDVLVEFRAWALNYPDVSSKYQYPYRMQTTVTIR